MAYPLNDLAELYGNQGKYAEAGPLYQRALCIRELSLGLEHFLTQTVRKNYPMLLQAMGRNEQAQRLEELS
jgi:tetratricopeptide (TPR) repeat protein